MKLLLIVFIFAVLIMLWRNRRVDEVAQRPAPKGKPQLMVVCAHCGTHLPAAEAVTGLRGVYCSTGHRARSES